MKDPIGGYYLSALSLLIVLFRTFFSLLVSADSATVMDTADISSDDRGGRCKH